MAGLRRAQLQAHRVATGLRADSASGHWIASGLRADVASVLCLATGIQWIASGDGLKRDDSQALGGCAPAPSASRPPAMKELTTVHLPTASGAANHLNTKEARWGFCGGGAEYDTLGSHN